MLLRQGWSISCHHSGWEQQGRLTALEAGLCQAPPTRWV